MGKLRGGRETLWLIMSDLGVASSAARFLNFKEEETLLSCLEVTDEYIYPPSLILSLVY